MLYLPSGRFLTICLVRSIISFFFFFFQGLRKSSDCGRAKKTIMPHSVPHMVQLRKFIVSEDTVFLLLQYAEGKKPLEHTSNYQLPFPLIHMILFFPILLLLNVPLFQTHI